MTPRWLVGSDAVLEPAPDTPTVWLFAVDDIARLRADAVAPLPGEAAGFARAADAAERLLRRRLSRLLLATVVGCRPGDVAIARSPAGAPIVVAPAGWHLSVAARWPVAAVAVARHPVGVDVEAVGEMLPPDFLTAAEHEGLRNSRSDAALWAAKEAHAKWTGHPRELEPGDIATRLRHPGLVPGSTAPPDPSIVVRAEAWMPGPARHDASGDVTSRFGTTRCWLHATPTHIAAFCIDQTKPKFHVDGL